MSKSILAVFACMIAGSAYAQTASTTTPSPEKPVSCKAQAADKKLAGAALNSFMKKCETDAGKACDSSAAEKKLAGAAKTSFTKKCIADTVGQ